MPGPGRKFERGHAFYPPHVTRDTREQYARARAVLPATCVHSFRGKPRECSQCLQASGVHLNVERIVPTAGSAIAGDPAALVRLRSSDDEDDN